MSKKVISIIFSVISVVLVAALTFTVFMIVDKNKEIKKMNNEISQNKAAVEESQKAQQQLQEQLDSANTEKEQAKQELEAAKQQNSQLERENSDLKKEIEMLKAGKRRAEIIAAISQNPPQSGDKICYLTFDDGPSDNTLKILDILKDYNIKATFFVTNSPKIEYVKRIHEEGHTVALHTASHEYSQIYVSKEAYYADLQTISNVVESLTGVKSTIIRFPGGSNNKVSASYCTGIMSDLVVDVLKRGYSYFDWNVSSGDADKGLVPYARIRDNVLNRAKNKHSICVLMHDNGAKTTTVQALPEIIEGLHSQGFKFDSLKADSYGFRFQTLNN